MGKKIPKKPVPTPTSDKKVVGDCPYCGQVGGVSQFDPICGEHDATKATGWVIEGRFHLAKKP